MVELLNYWLSEQGLQMADRPHRHPEWGSQDNQSSGTWKENYKEILLIYFKPLLLILFLCFRT